MHQKRLKTRADAPIPTVETVRIFPDLHSNVSAVSDDRFYQFIVENCSDLERLCYTVLKCSQVGHIEVSRRTRKSVAPAKRSGCLPILIDKVVKHRVVVRLDIRPLIVQFRQPASTYRGAASPKLCNECSVIVVSDCNIRSRVLCVSDGDPDALQILPSYFSAHVADCEHGAEHSKQASNQCLPAMDATPERLRDMVAGFGRAGPVNDDRKSIRADKCHDQKSCQGCDKAHSRDGFLVFPVHSVVPRLKRNLPTLLSIRKKRVAA